MNKVKYYRQKKLLQNSKQNVDFYKYSPKTLVTAPQNQKGGKPDGPAAVKIIYAFVSEDSVFFESVPESLPESVPVSVPEPPPDELCSSFTFCL